MTSDNSVITEHVQTDVIIPHLLGNKEKVVVMDQDEVTRLVDFCDALSKSGISRFVVRVVEVGGSVFGSDILPEQVMKQGPKC